MPELELRVPSSNTHKLLSDVPPYEIWEAKVIEVAKEPLEASMYVWRDVCDNVMTFYGDHNYIGVISVKASKVTVIRKVSDPITVAIVKVP